MYADPTYDIPFKMLFAQEQNKRFLISFLNGLLGFKGNKEIQDIEYKNVELDVSEYKNEIDKSGIQCFVDVLCTTKCQIRR